MLQQGDPIEERYKEHTERGSVIDQLVYCINSYREAAMSNDPKFDHIDLSEKQKVIFSCARAYDFRLCFSGNCEIKIFLFFNFFFP